MKTKLTFEEYCTLVGLATLAKETDKQMVALVRSIAGVTGEVLDEYDYGHAADLVYAPEGSNPTESIKLMLSKLGIVYEKEVRDADKEDIDANMDVFET